MSTRLRRPASDHHETQRPITGRQFLRTTVVVVPQGPGLGIEIDDEKVRHYAIQTVPVIPRSSVG